MTEWPDCYTNLSILTNCSAAARRVLRFLVTVVTFRLSLPFLFHQSYIPTNKRREYKACGFPVQKKCRMLFHPELQNSLLCIAAIALTQFGHSLLEALAGLFFSSSRFQSKLLSPVSTLISWTVLTPISGPADLVTLGVTVATASAV